MLFFNKNGEILNLWRFALRCSEISSETFACLIDQTDPEDSPLSDESYVEWGKKLASQFLELRDSGLYNIDFSGNNGGYNHIVDSLSSMSARQEEEVNEQAAHVQIVTESISESVPYIEKRLLQYYMPADHSFLSADLDADTIKLIKASFYRLTFLDNMSLVIDLGNRAQKLLKSSNDDDKAREFRALYQYAVKKAGEAIFDLKKSIKHQKLDIFDRQVSYLERAARALDRYSKSNDRYQSITNLTIPAEIFCFSPETVLLTVLLYREISILNQGNYSDDYWVIPMTYQTHLGIYGKATVGTDNFFRKVQREYINSTSQDNYPFEIIKVSSRVMLKLQKGYWDLFELASSANELCDLTEGNAKIDIHARFFQLSDDGGRGFYNMTCAVCGAFKDASKPKKLSEYDVLKTYVELGGREFPDMYYNENGNTDHDDLIKGIVSFFRNNDLNKAFKSNNDKKPIVFSKGGQNWRPSYYRFWIGFLCYLYNGSIEFKLNDDGDIVISESAIALVQKFDSSCYRRYVESLHKNTVNLVWSRQYADNFRSVRFSISVTSFSKDSILYSWLFGNGQLPSFADEQKKQFIDSVVQAFKREYRKKLKIGSKASNKESWFSRKQSTTNTERALVSIILAYKAALVYFFYDYGNQHVRDLLVYESQKDHKVYLSSYDFKNNKVMETQDIETLCEYIFANIDAFERFLIGLNPREENAGEGTLKCILECSYWKGGSDTTGRKALRETAQSTLGLEDCLFVKITRMEGSF